MKVGLSLLFFGNMAARPTNPPQTLGSTQPVQPVIPKTSNQQPQTLRISPLVGKGIEQQTKVPVLQELRKPLKWVLVGGIALFVGVWLLTSIYNMVLGFGKSKTDPVTKISPVATSTSTKTATNNACDKIDAKMKAAQIKSTQVDKVFWQKYPDRKSKLIDANDAASQQEWCAIASELAEKK
jgi:hypothetical protein